MISEGVAGGRRGKIKADSEVKRVDTVVHFVAISSKLSEQFLDGNHKVSEAASALRIISSRGCLHNAIMSKLPARPRF